MLLFNNQGLTILLIFVNSRVDKIILLTSYIFSSRLSTKILSYNCIFLYFTFTCEFSFQHNVYKTINLFCLNIFQCLHPC